VEDLSRFIGEKPSGCLYHYTGAAGLIGIVGNRKLWATDYRHLNDRKEYQIGALLLQDELETRGLEQKQRANFDRFIAETQRGCFVLSFSENGDQLSQWRAYSPGGNGYALGFEQENALFASAKQHSFNLIRCVYDRAEQRKLSRYLVDSFVEGIVSRQSRVPGADLRSRIKAFADRYNWGLALALLMSALKHSGFEEEREWRLVSQYPDDALYGVSFRPGRFGVTPYFELPLSIDDRPRHIDEIIIGPTSNKAASRSALDLLLSKNDTTAGLVKASRTPLRN
jgi:hypothetical protein